MKQLEKILVAMDFDQPSRDALQMATLLAKAFRSEIILILIIPEIMGLKIDRGKLRRIETQKLIKIEMDLKKKGVSSVETIVRFGIPFEQIIEHADDLDVNLIVVGSGEKEKKYPLGSRPRES